jgi:hypothetical protein
MSFYSLPKKGTSAMFLDTDGKADANKKAVLFCMSVRSGAVQSAGNTKQPHSNGNDNMTMKRKEQKIEPKQPNDDPILNISVLPWKLPPLNEWSIVGMNHYRLGGEKRLFVSMTKDSRCIIEEGKDNDELWMRLRQQAIALT